MWQPQAPVKSGKDFKKTVVALDSSFERHLLWGLQVNHRGGSGQKAVLHVDAVVLRGIYAYADRSELFNTAPLNGQPVTALISAFQYEPPQ